MEEVEIKDLIQKNWKELQDTLEVKFKEMEKEGQARAELESKIAKLNEQIDSLEAKLARPPVVEQKETDDASKKAFTNWMRKGVVAPEEVKLLASDEGASGGYLVPSVYDSAIIEKLRNESAMRGIATVKTITGYAYERVVQKNKFTIKVRGERETANAPSTTADNMFGLLRIPVHDYQPDPPPAITRTELEDSATNLETWLMENLVEDFAEKEGTDFITGSGLNSAEGILTANITSVKSGSATGIKADTLIDLTYALKSKFANNAKFLMHRTTIGKIRQLKDPSTGQYLWAPALSVGEPQQFLGYPIVSDDNMPAIAGGAYPIVFGDFSWYYIIDRRGIVVERDTTKYFPYITFFSTKRTGGQCIREEAFRTYLIST